MEQKKSKALARKPTAKKKQQKQKRRRERKYKTAINRIRDELVNVKMICYTVTIQRDVDPSVNIKP